MTSRKRVGVLALLLGALVLSLSMPALAQDDAKEGETKASRGRGGEGAADANITDSSDVNGPESDVAAPPSKGGTQTRGGYCQVHVDNRTNLIIKLFVDGKYRGAMGPWGDVHVYAVAGPTRLYARADFTDGTYSYWGPRVVNCQSTYHWRLSR